MLANIEKVRARAEKNKNKPSTSLKPLKFDESPEDSPLKGEIVRRINEKNLTYSDLYNYCTELAGGNSEEGQKWGYNLISGLKNRHSFIDTTLTLFANFLNLEIQFVEKETPKTEEDENE